MKRERHTVTGKINRMDKCSASLKAYAIEEYKEKTQLKKGINNSKKRKEVDGNSKKYKNENKIKKEIQKLAKNNLFLNNLLG